MKKDSEQQKISNFMILAKQKVRDTPTVNILPDEHELRIHLIDEEVRELFKAMEVASNTHNPYRIVDIADALVDIIYVVKGAANTYGINLAPLFDAVHKANMRKVKSKIIKNKIGIVEKPKNFKHPDLKSLLIKQGALIEND